MEYEDFDEQLKNQHGFSCRGLGSVHVDVTVN